MAEKLDLTITVTHASGEKCLRCLRWIEAGLEIDDTFPGLCLRCLQIMREDFHVIDGRFVRKNVASNVSYSDFFGKIFLSDNFWS